jgi:4'-phosphopantetheinyl transferase
MYDRNWACDLGLTSNEVHIWAANLDIPAHDLDKLRSTLSADERTRAARFQFHKDHNAYVAGRGILRDILGAYLGVEPEGLVFGYNEHGKPALRFGNLNFNVSHSGQLALYAISIEREVGVDVEIVRPLDDLEGISRGNFSAYENKVLQSVSEEQRLQGFFNCWTRKEAFIKAVGDGLAYPLEQFDVTLRPGDRAALLRIHENEQPDWSIFDVTPIKGYVAAIAAPGKGWQPVCGWWAKL